jgi:CRISPR/Cas system-associated endoribonuclease Cas2
LIEPSLNSTIRSKEDDQPGSAKVKNIEKTKKKIDSARRSRLKQV